MLEEAAVMNEAYVLGGGGDFLAAVKSLKEVKSIKLSTGGGALLAVVAKKGEVPAFTAFFE
jgi:3-phosphoglycerate kinase